MSRKIKDVHPDIITPKDTLVIIGNGFDIWQDLPTSYDAFETYYREHLDEILKKLKIKKRTLYDDNGNLIYDQDGKPVTFTDVELFYGDPFNPGRLEHDFWNSFESSLNKLNDQRLNLYFGKDREGLAGIRKSAHNAQRILREAFCGWIATIQISEKDVGYHFGDQCVFINFNYTDTLQKRFHIDANDEYHIHGEASDKESIIFGHVTHPEYPMPELYQFGGRFQGLFFVEEALYQSDKHVEDNYVDLCMFLAAHRVNVAHIKHIYVLGHSFGAEDFDYFKHIVHETQGIDEEPENEIPEGVRAYLDHMSDEEKRHLNIQYAIHHAERTPGMEPVSYPVLEKMDEIICKSLEDPYYHMSKEEQYILEAAAVHKRFLEEQAARNRKKESAFYKMVRRANRKCMRLYGKKYFAEDIKPEGKTAAGEPDVQWHISYYKEKDKRRIEKAMERMGCNNYTLYPTIDACLAPFKR